MWHSAEVWYPVWSIADTPIEEFSPTPAFPALQYLESVDEGGVAWMAGLRTGDFLIKVRTLKTHTPRLSAMNTRLAIFKALYFLYKHDCLNHT